MATELQLLYDIGIILIAAAFASYLSRLVRQPPLAFYIISGLLIGPFALSIVKDLGEVRTLAELGVAFLLFVAGLDIDITKLGSYGKYTLLAGILQVSFTFASGVILSTFLGFTTIESLYLGLVIANSSTMVVTKILANRNIIDSLRGKTAMGILVVQDIIFILALPLLEHYSSSLPIAMHFFWNASLLVLLSAFAGFFIIPRVMRHVADDEEMFLLTSVALCFAFIGLADFLGFSIAIGGLIAGVVVSSRYSKSVMDNVRSLEEFFTIIFFSALGMQLDVGGLGGLLLPFFVLFFAVVLLKPLILTFILGLLGFGTRTPVMVGAMKGQVSELSYVLAQQGTRLGHIGGGVFTIIMGLTLFTTILTPYLFSTGEKIAGELYRRYPHGIISNRRIKDLMTPKVELEDHVILVGCHRTGKEVLDRMRGAKFIIIDHDPEVVETLRHLNCVYGTPDNHHTLERLGVRKARAIVITSPDQKLALFLAEECRKLNPAVKIISRAGSANEALALYEKGADIVFVPEMLAGKAMGDIVSDILEGRNVDHWKETSAAYFRDVSEKNFLI